jgi:hypothetical protein
MILFLLPSMVFSPFDSHIDAQRLLGTRVLVDRGPQPPADEYAYDEKYNQDDTER